MTTSPIVPCKLAPTTTPTTNVESYDIEQKINAISKKEIDKDSEELAHLTSLVGPIITEFKATLSQTNYKEATDNLLKQNPILEKCDWFKKTLKQTIFEDFCSKVKEQNKTNHLGEIDPKNPLFPLSLKKVLNELNFEETINLFPLEKQNQMIEIKSTFDKNNQIKALDLFETLINNTKFLVHNPLI
jgi:hypothetical protein